MSLILNGLDGSNPLAFLAAIGTLRILTLVSETADSPDWLGTEVTMNWVPNGVAWRPVLHTSALRSPTPEAMLQTLSSSLSQDFANHPLALFGSREGLREWMVAQVTAASVVNRERGVNWLSALCSDLAPDATSQLQTVRRDYFLGNLKNIIVNTTPSHLKRTLFSSWDYGDPLNNQSLHIDPTEDRRHALQWHQPSGDPTRNRRGGMLGANRLAIEAFPLFQSLASGEKLSTKGFVGQTVYNTRWTWPIWSCPIGIDGVNLLLGLTDIQAEYPDLQLLRARGIASVFRCRRILVEKTPNFTPAIAVL